MGDKGELSKIMRGKVKFPERANGRKMGCKRKERGSKGKGIRA